jgi:hypothetical protein
MASTAPTFAVEGGGELSHSRMTRMRARAARASACRGSCGGELAEQLVGATVACRL